MQMKINVSCLNKVMHCGPWCLRTDRILQLTNITSHSLTTLSVTNNYGELSFT